MAKVLYLKKNRVNKKYVLTEMETSEYIRVRPLANMVGMPNSAVKRLIEECAELAKHRDNVDDVLFCEVGAFLELLNCPKDKDGNYIEPTMDTLYVAAEKLGISYFRLQKACDLGITKSVSVGCRRYVNTKGLGNYITEHGGVFVVDKKYISGLHATG